MALKLVSGSSTMPIFDKTTRRVSVEPNANDKSESMLHSLISQQLWAHVDTFLSERKTKPTSPSVSSSSSIMHYACQFNAPLYVIAKLSARFPSQDTTDDRGRYPIHVAVANGCEPDVIQFLIRSNPKHPGLQDKHGKTPLHYAGECYAKSYADHYHFPEDYSHVQRRLLEVVEMLVKAAPESANVEDEEEMNPIEYAVLNSCNITVVKLMQRASRKEWRRLTRSNCSKDPHIKKPSFGHRSLGARTA